MRRAKSVAVFYVVIMRGNNYSNGYSVLPCLFKCLMEVVVGIFAVLILRVYNLACIQLL